MGRQSSINNRLASHFDAPYLKLLSAWQALGPSSTVRLPVHLACLTGPRVRNARRANAEQARKGRDGAPVGGISSGLTVILAQPGEAPLVSCDEKTIPL